MLARAAGANAEKEQVENISRDRGRYGRAMGVRMKYHEQVALILKGAFLWGEWIRLNCYAGAGSSPTAKRLAQVAELNWRAWRDEQTEEHIVTAAQSVVRIAKEFCK